MHVKFTSAGEGNLQPDRVLMKKIEFAQTKRQLLNLSTFLPDEILRTHKAEITTVKWYVGILMATQIFGTTKLCSRYNKIGKGGMYRLTATLNAYYGSIIETLLFYGGDVLICSSEILVTQWKVMPHESLIEILHEVACCALFIQRYFGNFETEANVYLTLKIAFTCGNMGFFTIGDVKRKCFAIAGESLSDIAGSLEAGVAGDVVISKGAWAHMLQERYLITDEGYVVKIWKVIYKANEGYKRIHYEEKQLDLLKIIDVHMEYRKQTHDRKNFQVVNSDTNNRAQLMKRIPPRQYQKIAYRNWKVSELREYAVSIVSEQIDESQPVEYLTDMNEVTIQLVQIIPSSTYEPIYMELMNKAFEAVSTIAGAGGIVINFISMFKYVSILIIFGVKGQLYGTEPQYALKSATIIKQTLGELSSIKSISVGVANSLVYSGVIGHPLRKDYMVFGEGITKVHKMTSMFPDKIMCDYKTFKTSKLSSFYFQIQKSKEEALLMFEYNEGFERPKAVIVHALPIVGRCNELNAVRSVIYTPEDVGYYGICFHGKKKLGKTALMKELLKKYRNNSSFKTASIELENSSKIPFFCIERLYKQLYDARAKVNSDDIYRIIGLPRDLIDLREQWQNMQEDVAMQKYRMLNYFRDMTKFTNDQLTLIFIDNAQDLDLQSWEILELTLIDKSIRLVLCADFEPEASWDLRFKISLNSHIKCLELQPVENHYVPTIACQFLEIAGIPKQLVSLLVNTCEGRPGHMQICLLHLINHGNIELKLIHKTEEDKRNFIYPNPIYTGYHSSQIIPVVEYTEYKLKADTELTMEAICQDVFRSFTPYEQLVIKTGAVLGNLFTRTLLVVALKYPSENSLSKVIYTLIRRDIFECGSKFIYANEMDDNDADTFCCRCYFEDDYFNVSHERFLPKYAYCKILHFKNKGIRDVAYNTLPGNQRKEMHMLCTDLLENMSNTCPACMKLSITNLFNLGKFKDVIIYCSNLSQAYPTYHNTSKAEDTKNCIRTVLMKPDEVDNISDEIKINQEPQGAYKIRSETYNPNQCNCISILLRVYADLIYHSECAGHLAKRIFFTMQYGFLLIHMLDFTTAISYLTQAREICFIDTALETATVSDIFRKLLVGKIEIYLAKASLELRQLKAARSHLAIAIRQYNIPTLALSYKFYNAFVTRKFLVNKWLRHSLLYKDVIVRCDMGLCLGLCAKLFSLEGEWKLAQLTAAYSIYLVRNVNPNIQILLEVYCTAIEIQRYCVDTHICEKMTRVIAKDAMQNYCNNIMYQVYYIMNILNELFQFILLKGDIVKAIRLGYRILDVGLMFFYSIRNHHVITMLTVLLMYNFRIEEAVSVCKLLHKSSSAFSRTKLVYFTAALKIKMWTSFAVEPIESILEFARDYLLNKPKKMNWDDYKFTTMIQLHFLKTRNFGEADEWNFNCNYTEHNIRKDDIFQTFIFAVQCKIFNIMRNKRVRSLATTSEEKILSNYMKWLKKAVDSSHKLYLPLYHCMSSWIAMIEKKKSRAFRDLSKAESIAEKQENLLYAAFVIQLRNSYTGGYSRDYEDIENNYKTACNLTLTEWAQLMQPFPLI